MLLQVSDLRTGYGTVPALYGVSLEVERGEIVAILGPNGAGKTTTLSAISGLLKPWAGEIVFDGRPIGGADPKEIVAGGIAHSPEGRRVFPALTVEQNLRLGSWPRRDDSASCARNLERVFGYFPVLGERSGQRAGSLSGGEQQMLAIGRALMSEPTLLIIDEASLGLAPVIVERVFDIVREIRRDGATVLLVEQNAPMTLALADRVYLMQRGQITAGGPAAEMREQGVLDAYLGPMAAAAAAAFAASSAPPKTASPAPSKNPAPSKKKPAAKKPARKPAARPRPRPRSSSGRTGKSGKDE